MILRLVEEHLALLQKEAKRTFPIEACALLFGRQTGKENVVQRIVVTSNVLQSSTKFEIDSRAFYEAFTEANKQGLDFIGFFHSHPASANPSETDKQFMKLWGSAVWLILSLTDRKFSAFQLLKGNISTLTLRIERRLKE